MQSKRIDSYNVRLKRSAEKDLRRIDKSRCADYMPHLGDLSPARRARSSRQATQREENAFQEILQPTDHRMSPSIRPARQWNNIRAIVAPKASSGLPIFGNPLLVVVSRSRRASCLQSYRSIRQDASYPALALLGTSLRTKMANICGHRVFGCPGHQRGESL